MTSYRLHCIRENLRIHSSEMVRRFFIIYRLSGQKEFVIRFTGPFAKVENLTVISTSFLKKFTGQIVTIENSTVILERCLRVVLQKMGIIP